MINTSPQTIKDPFKIMIVCDDPDIARVWGFTLQQVGVSTFQIPQSQEVIKILIKEQPDLIVIDSRSMDLEGIELLKKLRDKTGNPILLFIPSNDENLLLDAYNAGIDEVTNQVISPRIFIAKIRAWLRHVQASPDSDYQKVTSKGLHLDLNRGILWRDPSTPVQLTSLEVRLLSYLLRNPGRFIEAPALIKYIWSQEENVKRTRLKHVVYRLRLKIETDPDNPVYLLSEGKLGYCFRTEELN